MAEGRMLKKAISTSRRLADLQTDSARMLYTWIIPHLDIEGRFPAEPSIIRGVIVPRIKSFTEEVIAQCLLDMADKGLITMYEVDGDMYLEFRKFKEHQLLNPKREAVSKIPDPIYESSPTKRRCLKRATWERLWGEWEKSEKRCPVCGRQSVFIPGVGNVIDGHIKLHIDHIIPLSKGGLNDDDNLRIICAKCNLSKGNSIENITVEINNSGQTLDKLRTNSGQTPTQEKLREVKLREVNTRAREDDLPVDNSTLETTLLKKEDENPLSKNTHGERWTVDQGDELEIIMVETKTRYGAKYHQQVYVWVQTHYNRANPTAVIYCLRRLIQERLAGKSIPAPGRWLEAVMATENAKHEARVSEREHEERKAEEIRDVAKLISGIGIMPAGGA